MRRFAATLAVVLVASPVWAAGWYLMRPPFRKGPAWFATSYLQLSGSVDTDASLDAWDTVDSFESATQCTNGKLDEVASLKRGVAGTTKGAADLEEKALKSFTALSLAERVNLLSFWRSEKAICIASDDPGLAAVAVRKQWRLMIPPQIEKFENVPKYLDEVFDTKAPLKQWQTVNSHPSKWACEDAKETLMMQYLFDSHLKEVNRDQLEIARLDMNSDQVKSLLGYVDVRDAQCLAGDDARLK